MGATWDIPTLLCGDGVPLSGVQDSVEILLDESPSRRVPGSTGALSLAVRSRSRDGSSTCGPYASDMVAIPVGPGMQTPTSLCGPLPTVAALFLCHRNRLRRARPCRWLFTCYAGTPRSFLARCRQWPRREAEPPLPPHVPTRARLRFADLRRAPADAPPPPPPSRVCRTLSFEGVFSRSLLHLPDLRASLYCCVRRPEMDACCDQWGSPLRDDTHKSVTSGWPVRGHRRGVEVVRSGCLAGGPCGVRDAREKGGGRSCGSDAVGRGVGAAT